MNPTTINTNNNQNENNPNSLNSNAFYIDAKKYIPLTILNWSYFQTLILFIVLGGIIIPIYLTTNQMIHSINRNFIK